MNVTEEIIRDTAATDQSPSVAGPGLVHVRVASARDIAERVRELTLEPAGREPLPAWAPGAHIDLRLRPDLSRSYSLCSAPDAPAWRIAVLEEAESRGGSHHVHHRVHVGDELAVTGPVNSFPLRLESRRILFVAGGIGITPILPMVAEAEQAAADWRLIHLARSPAAAAYLDELASYGNRVLAHVDTDGGPLDLVTTLDSLSGDEADLYACGPAPLLDALECYADARAGSRLFVERFVNDQDLVRSDDHAFVVETSDGTRIEVGARQTILDALEEAGVRMLSSCREGTCGTCETTVLEGVPDHRDAVLTDEERACGETMMVCVSRCRGRRLVLDL